MALTRIQSGGTLTGPLNMAAPITTAPTKALVISSGDVLGSSGTNAGGITLSAGSVTGEAVNFGATAGAIVLRAGQFDNNQWSANYGGSIEITPGSSGEQGGITLSTGNSGSGDYSGEIRFRGNGTESLRISCNGAWSLGSFGYNYGLYGQVLMTYGDMLPPSWTSIATINGSSMTEGGNIAVVTPTGTQTLTNKTITGYTETVFAVTGTTPALSPTNGSIQTWTLSANSTPTAGTWAAGQSLILGVTASSFTVTWPSVVWSKVGGSGAAPTLTSTGVNWVILWKVGTTVYGSFLGTT